MTALRTSSLALGLALPFAALATPPDACTLLNPDEVNVIAATKVERVQPQKSGNPSQCGYLDARRGAVLVISVREVQYAVKDEFGMERESLEKIYKARVKPLDTVGEQAFWMPVNKSLWFRRNKMIVSVTFSTPKNQNELDTAQLARVVETRLTKPQQ